MRVSFAMTYNNMTMNIDNDQSDINQLSAQVTSGDRMQDPQDDPLAWSEAFMMQQNIQESNTFQSNIKFAQSWNQASENALSQLSNLLVQAKQTAISAVNTSTSAEAQSGQVDTVDQLYQEAVNLMNTQYDGSYLFSGSKTSVEPYQATDPTAAVPTYQYMGDNGNISVRAGKNITDTVNVNLNSTFTYQGTGTYVDTQGTQQTATGTVTDDILGTLKNLRDAIANGGQTTVTANVNISGTPTPETMTLTTSALIAGIDAANNQVINCQSQAGTRLNKLQIQLSTIQDLNVTQQTALSNTQDTDMVSAITQLQQKQTAFQAALEVTATVGKLSLTQYLG